MKRTMNRIVSLLLALAMVFALMACGKKEVPPSNNFCYSVQL